MRERVWTPYFFSGKIGRAGYTLTNRWLFVIKIHLMQAVGSVFSQIY